MRLLALLPIVALLGSPAHAQRDRQPEVSADSLKAMQTLELEVSADRAFGAVISALADKNFTVDSANKDAGLVTATENTKSRMSGLGMATRQNTIKLSIVIVSMGEAKARVRVSAIDNYVYTYHGKKYRDENTQVSTASFYQDLFSAVRAAI